ncbi:MAG: prepilin-type N-terminal cleavage/methylation domain-containing protein [Planctomycetota bacterium]|nr:prepilin-type N-terminal cleavage/methylation domain-containing protein [Planctomycetota bacterium]
MRERDRGFTLAEMLIVIGIIGVLGGLLLPVLARARRSADGITCASNLRQWGMATEIYANDNNGFLPRRGQGVGPTFQVARPTDWFNALPPLMKMPAYTDLVSTGRISRPPDRSVWVCPEARDMTGPNFWSYGMNMGLSVWEANQNNGQPDKITGVGSTSNLVLFADAPGNYCSVFPSKYQDGYNPVPRHSNNTVNICFLDGHVDAVSGSYIGLGNGLIEHADIRWHPPGNTWNKAQ